VSVVKCSLAGIVRTKKKKKLLPELEKVVKAANKMEKRVSMLAKELLLTKLEAGERLPTLNQSFFSALYTSLRSGKWNHGHDALLAQRQVDDPGLGCVMLQIMALVGKRLAAALDSQYRCHYERFYKRWKRVCGDTVDGEENGDVLDDHFLDPQEAQLNELVRHAWLMRRDLEAREARGFALFPESKIQVSYVTLDATCIAYLYRRLYPDSFRVPGKRPETTRAKTISDVTADHTPEIFAKLFRLPKIRRLRRSHQFRYSLQTDGVAGQRGAELCAMGSFNTVPRCEPVAKDHKTTQDRRVQWCRDEACC
ncbi:MAG: hypothetical protein GY743_24525, partial [Planctomycetaceae bacterium]|nr:hypothetical protein [Planctomycetaceae bacterium]